MTDKKKSDYPYACRILIALDQLINAICGGMPDESISAKCYRKRNDSTFWKILYIILDDIFFWQEDHCHDAYDSEVYSKQLPKEYQQQKE